jgi:ATP-binding cassette subfamily F protein 3
VFVSHDRRFIEALADHVVEIENEQARTFPGDYAYYLWRKQREEEEQAPEPGLPLAEEGRRRESEGGLSASQRVRLQDKAQKRDLRRLLREEEELLARLDELQEEHGRLEGLLAREEVYRDGQKVKRIKRDLEELTEAQNNLMRRWEQVDKSRRTLESVGIKIS